MTSIELQNIISLGESETLEFKTAFSKEVIESLVAFANTKGGSVLIGVSNNKNIIGVNIGEESIQNWLNEIKTKTEPSIIPDFESYNVDDKIIIRITVKEFPNKPIAYQGRYYQRLHNSNHQLAVQEINDLYLKSTQNSWDSYLFPNSNYDNLNEDIILEFINKVNDGGRFKLTGTPKDCLRKLQFLSG